MENRTGGGSGEPAPPSHARPRGLVISVLQLYCAGQIPNQIVKWSWESGGGGWGAKVEIEVEINRAKVILV